MPTPTSKDLGDYMPYVLTCNSRLAAWLGAVPIPTNPDGSVKRATTRRQRCSLLVCAYEDASTAQLETVQWCYWPIEGEL